METISKYKGLVDYIKSNIDKIDTKLLIHVSSPSTVKLYGPLNADRERQAKVNGKKDYLN
ncbi:hypothetical protein psyc5s11_32720 [Clostridium gelidum]|uniref:Uncharacterized protein n=1 Tax=Clostridium gelidum TaxID=704125 RepID=A0ABN6IYJ4_9CLOT|nr:hypothetical protein [Clostridium gelidum]BCZ47205.1 hypothetical protein psyc5s11_32720 [Clostridium gelidum]